MIPFELDERIRGTVFLLISLLHDDRRRLEK